MAQSTRGGTNSIVRLLAVIPLVVLAVIVLLALVELGARFVVNVDQAIARRTPWEKETFALGWRHAQGESVEWPPNSGTVVTTNQSGFVGPAIPMRSPETFRIVVLGDELVESLDTPYEETFCALVERELNDNPLGTAKRIEVINCGVSGYSTVQQFLLANNKGGNLHARLQPDAIVMMVSLPNDLLESNERQDDLSTIPPVAVKVGRPYAQLTRGAVARFPVNRNPRYLPRENPLSFLCYFSTLANIAFVNPALKPVPRMPPSRSMAAFYRGELSKSFEAGWEMMHMLLRETHYDTVSQNASLMVVTTPDRPEVIHGKAWSKALEKFASEESVDPDIAEKRIERIAEEEGLSLISLTRRLRQYVCRDQLQYSARDGYGFLHPERSQWTRKGHRVVAEILADALRTQYTEQLGGVRPAFGDIYARSVPGRFRTEGVGGLLLSPTAFTATIDEPIVARAARALVDNTTSIPAGYGYYIEGATPGCDAFNGAWFEIDPAVLASGKHVVHLDIVDASNQTVRMADALELVTGLHFGQIEKPAPGDVLTEPLTIEGWAISMRGLTSVEIQANKKVIAQTLPDQQRPDLVEQLGEAVAASPPGFSVTMPSLQMEPGEHSLQLWLVTVEGERFPVGEPVRVTVPL